MVQEKVKLNKKQADGYVIAIGPVNLVFVVTDINPSNLSCLYYF